MFGYNSGDLVVTSDEGSTWFNPLALGAGVRPDVGKSLVSDYHAEWDGWYYWKPSSAYMYQIGIFTDKLEIAYDSQIPADERESLVNILKEKIQNNREYVPWDSMSDVYMPIIEEDFEDVLTLESLSHVNATVFASIDDKYEGFKSGKIQVDTGEWGWFKTDVNYPSDSTIVTMECWVKTSADILDTESWLMQMIGSNTVAQVQIDVKQLLQISFDRHVGPTKLLKQNNIPTLDKVITLTSGAWHHMRWDTKLHPTAGWTRLFLDDELVLESVGISTLELSDNITELRWGVNSNQKGLAVNFDNCKSGKTPASN